MEPEALGREDPGDELRTWRTVIVPVFGPLWVLLPFLVWFVIFGSDLVEVIAGGSGWWIVGTAVILAIAGWAAVAGARLMHACQSSDCAFPWDLVVRTSVILFVQLLFGAVFFLLIMYGILSDWQPGPRALIGAGVLALAWMGWSGITPQSRRLALGYIRRLRGRA